jgi:hypothetical protein
VNGSLCPGKAFLTRYRILTRYVGEPVAFSQVQCVLGVSSRYSLGLDAGVEESDVDVDMGIFQREEREGWSKEQTPFSRQDLRRGY